MRITKILNSNMLSLSEHMTSIVFQNRYMNRFWSHLRRYVDLK